MYLHFDKGIRYCQTYSQPDTCDCLTWNAVVSDTSWQRIAFDRFDFGDGRHGYLSSYIVGDDVIFSVSGNESESFVFVGPLKCDSIKPAD